MVILTMKSVKEFWVGSAIFWPMVMSIAVLVIHAIISAIYVFYDSGRNLKRAGLQLFNMLIFEHVYTSMINGYPVYELQETRVLETIFESAPQAVIQLYFVALYDYKSHYIEIWFSLILTIISLTSAVRSLDAYGLKSGIGFQWHALLFITRAVEISLKIYLIVLMALWTSAKYTVVYVTLSSLFVALITFYFRSREFSQHEASVFIREVCISGINAYLFHPGLEANVFLFTNTFKILESIVFIVVIHQIWDVTHWHQNPLIWILIAIFVSYIAIYCADIYDDDKYRNARDEDLNSLFEAKHFELIMKFIRKNKFKLKDLSLDQLIYLRENGAPLSMFEFSDIEVYNLYAVGYDFSEYNTEDLESTKGSSKTALIWASQKGHSSMIRNLIDAGVNLEAKDETGSTALISASKNGHDSTVQMLIDAGADVKAKMDDGSTALFCARKNGHESIMKMLIDAEADVKESAKDGNTFLIGVSEHGAAEIDDVKAEIDDGKSAIICASGNRHDSTTRNLMDAGADSDVKNKYKCSDGTEYIL